jgi:hypothetical protein
MLLKFWIVNHVTPDQVFPYIAWTPEAPTLEWALDNLPDFAAAWQGRRPVQPEIDDDGRPIVEGEADEAEAPVPGEVQWVEGDPNHKFEVHGPFNTPPMLDTMVVHRPGAQTPLVVVQASSKTRARQLVRESYGACPGMRVVRMLPHRERVLGPLP